MTYFDIDLEFDWDVVSSIANVIMALLALATLGFAVYQFLSFKRKEKEEERARLVICIERDLDVCYLVICNVGKNSAYNIKLSVNESFINSMITDVFKTVLSNAMKRKFMLLPNHQKKFYLCWGDDEKKICNHLLDVQVCYNDSFIEKEQFTMDEYAKGAYVESTDDYLKSISHSLKSINEKLSKSHDNTAKNKN